MKRRPTGDHLDPLTHLRDADGQTVRWLIGVFGIRTMRDYANEHWHGTGHRVRHRGELPVREIIPAESWKYLHLTADGKTAKGGGVEYLAVEFHVGAPGGLAEDGTTKRLRRIYRELAKEAGKPPSQTKVAERANCHRSTVRRRWSAISG